jgi:hypothetical protein
MRISQLVISLCLLLFPISGFAETPLILPIVITSDIPTSDETYNSKLDLVTDRIYDTIRFTGFSNEGGPLSVYCDMVGPLRKITYHGGSGSTAGFRSTYSICGQFDPIAGNGWILVELSGIDRVEITNKILHRTWDGTKAT